MRISYFTESLYPHVDGVSRTLARLFETLEEQGIDFQIFSPFQPAADISWSTRVVNVRSFRFPPYPDYRVTLPFQKLITRRLDAFQPDLIHVVSPTPTGLWARRLAGKRGIPAVASFHTHFVSYFRYYGISALEGGGWRTLRRFYNGFERVYPPSESIITELRSHGLENLTLWSRGINLDGFSPEHRDPRLPESVGAEPGKPVVLMVSRLVKEKDLLDLVDIDRHLRESGSDYALVLVGDGPLRERLEAEIPTAIFVGHQSGEELARWYASADVFVFPSTTETLGNVVLEAQASGVPAVVTDRGGPQDLITDGVTGYIVEANQPRRMAEMIGQLLRDPELRATMGREARERASSRSWAEINGELIDSYRAVIREYRERSAG